MIPNGSRRKRARLWAQLYAQVFEAADASDDAPSHAAGRTDDPPGPDRE